jgi:hypothetical protein
MFTPFFVLSKDVLECQLNQPGFTEVDVICPKVPAESTGPGLVSVTVPVSAPVPALWARRLGVMLPHIAASMTAHSNKPRGPLPGFR